MSKQIERLRHYTMADFAMDDDFIRWVNNPGEETNEFWNSVLEQLPAQAENIETAARIVRRIPIHTEKYSKEIKDEIWNKILDQAGKAPVISINRGQRLQRWVAAAVIIVIGSLTTYLLFNGNNEPPATGVVTHEMADDDMPPGGNKATLVLADGSHVDLESRNSGLLAQQGGSVVKKLQDGQLTYMKSNAETIDTVFNTVITPKGGQYKVTLSDGTKVWLNAASSLRFPAAFNTGSRAVEVSGEAYFEVAHEKSRPFYVKAGGMSVRVLGTKFNINAYGDNPGFKTTLLEGSVAIAAHNTNVLLKPGEQVGFENNMLGPVQSGVNLEQVVSWKNENFDFTNETLANIAKELSRWYNVEIDMEKSLLNKHFSGIVSRNNNLSKVLEVLEFSGGIRARIEGNRVFFSH